MRKKVAWGLPLGPPLPFGPPLPPVLRLAEAQPGAMVRPAIPVLLLQLTNRSSATKGVPHRVDLCCPLCPLKKAPNCPGFQAGVGWAVCIGL